LAGEGAVTRAGFRVASALVLALGACVRPRAPELTPTLAPVASLTLLESTPVETTLDRPDVVDAHVGWLAIVRGTKRKLDIASFYVSNREDKGGRLEPILAAVEDAAHRGVRVRLLVDAAFLQKYPESVARLRGAGVETRATRAFAAAGGVMHAKYFVADGDVAVLGSQNWDWRSLEHIHELGVRVNGGPIARALDLVFETDWEAAERDGGLAHPGPDVRFTPRRQGEVELVTSPRGSPFGEAAWDLPKLVAAIDGASTSVSVQLLTYAPRTRSGAPFPELDDALRRAAARGVRVRMLLSTWMDKKKEVLDALAAVPGVEVRLLEIPPHSSGPIPFARVAHAKYMVVDGGRFAWLGTANWEGDYFTASRNVGVFSRRGPLGEALVPYFEAAWTSPYARRWSPPRLEGGHD
jgi:phosphatidylserine/phosphatidylglycerophosphate/cardiolipin synthase-like enzyme